MPNANRAFGKSLRTCEDLAPLMLSLRVDGTQILTFDPKLHGQSLNAKKWPAHDLDHRTFGMLLMTLPLSSSILVTLPAHRLP